jgi:spermidine synthase
VLVLNRAYNSDVDPSEPRYLGFAYERWIAQAIDGLAPPPPKALDAVFVGGGAFTLPRWLRAVRPGSRSDVLEVDGGLVDFDRRMLGLRTGPRLQATVGDARLTMRRQPSHAADVVIGDAFSGLTVPWQLMTSQWMHEVRRVLKPRGVYVLNMVDLPPLRLLRAETATLLAAFAHVKMVGEPGAAAGGLPVGGNELLLASDGPLPPMRSPAKAQSYDQAEVERLTHGAEPLRDDYAPVDQLQTR